jgi:hypothetical protein
MMLDWKILLKNENLNYFYKHEFSNRTEQKRVPTNLVSIYFTKIVILIIIYDFSYYNFTKIIMMTK